MSVTISREEQVRKSPPRATPPGGPKKADRLEESIKKRVPRLRLDETKVAAIARRTRAAKKRAAEQKTKSQGFEKRQAASVYKMPDGEKKARMATGNTQWEGASTDNMTDSIRETIAGKIALPKPQSQPLAPDDAKPLLGKLLKNLVDDAGRPLCVDDLVASARTSKRTEPDGSGTEAPKDARKSPATNATKGSMRLARPAPWYGHDQYAESMQRGRGTTPSPKAPDAPRTPQDPNPSPHDAALPTSRRTGTLGSYSLHHQLYAFLLMLLEMRRGAREAQRLKGEAAHQGRLGGLAFEAALVTGRYQLDATSALVDGLRQILSDGPDNYSQDVQTNLAGDFRASRFDPELYEHTPLSTNADILAHCALASQKMAGIITQGKTTKANGSGAQGQDAKIPFGEIVLGEDRQLLSPYEINAIEKKGDDAARKTLADYRKVAANNLLKRGNAGAAGMFEHEADRVGLQAKRDGLEPEKRDNLLRIKESLEKRNQFLLEAIDERRGPMINRERQIAVAHDQTGWTHHCQRAYDAMKEHTRRAEDKRKERDAAPDEATKTRLTHEIKEEEKQADYNRAYFRQLTDKTEGMQRVFRQNVKEPGLRCYLKGRVHGPDDPPDTIAGASGRVPNPESEALSETVKQQAAHRRKRENIASYRELNRMPAGLKNPFGAINRPRLDGLGQPFKALAQDGRATLRRLAGNDGAWQSVPRNKDPQRKDAPQPKTQVREGKNEGGTLYDILNGSEQDIQSCKQAQEKAYQEWQDEKTAYEAEREDLKSTLKSRRLRAYQEGPALERRLDELMKPKPNSNRPKLEGRIARKEARIEEISRERLELSQNTSLTAEHKATRDQALENEQNRHAEQRTVLQDKLNRLIKKEGRSQATVQAKHDNYQDRVRDVKVSASGGLRGAWHASIDRLQSARQRRDSGLENAQQEYNDARCEYLRRTEALETFKKQIGCTEVDDPHAAHIRITRSPGSTKDGSSNQLSDSEVKELLDTTPQTPDELDARDLGRVDGGDLAAQSYSDPHMEDLAHANRQLKWMLDGLRTGKDALVATMTAATDQIAGEAAQKPAEHRARAAREITSQSAQTDGLIRQLVALANAAANMGGPR